MAKKPTLRDVAKQADVALSTVSQVLNNKPGVSTHTRRRVLAAAEEVGYRAKVTIDVPLSSDIKTIGLLTKRRNDEPLAMNPFYSHIIAGAERECSRQNISLMYANIEVDEHSRTKSLPVMLLDNQIDGVIVVGAFLDETVAAIGRKSGQNLVLVDAYLTEGNGFDSVLIENTEGATTAITHLIDKGHRHIALIGGDNNSHPSIMERRHVYARLMTEQGYEVVMEDSQIEIEYGYEAARRLIARKPDITAIFACADAIAIGVMSGLQDSGLRVPEDVSVIGFDGIDLAERVNPALTTIHVDKILMGTIAVRMLVDRATDPLRTPLKTLVTTRLIERDSVRDMRT